VKFYVNKRTLTKLCQNIVIIEVRFLRHRPSSHYCCYSNCAACPHPI